MEMLTDKVALITGGSSGFGAVTARVFARSRSLPGDRRKWTGLPLN